MRTIGIVVVLVSLAGCSPHDHEAHSSHEEAPAAVPVSLSWAAPDVPAGAYTLDKAHASLLFRVDHLGFSRYTARFKQFDAQLVFDPAKPAAAQVLVTVDARSIETDFPDPTQHDFNAQLRGEQWLKASDFQQVTFRSTHVEPTGPNTMRVDGELTLRSITRPMHLDATFNGGYPGHPLDPNARIGFSARGTLKRSEFGMTYGIPEPGSKFGVSDEVEVIIEAEFSGPAWKAASGAATTTM